MPAERTRGSRRTEADGGQLVWTLPVEPVDPSGISFTTAVTPNTFGVGNDSSSVFDDMPPLVDPPAAHPTSEFILFPPVEEQNQSSSHRRTTHTKKKPENHIPRPPNAFILFRSSFIKSQHVSTEVETNHSTLSKIIGLTWQSLPEEERQIWHDKAKAALEDHKRKYPKYAFRPLQNRSVRGVGGGGVGGGTGEKRKVREVEPKDLKRCAKIAELLVSGKKGNELNAAIQEFDKHHVPEIITRFEAPITARQYRRSSSVPIPDVKESSQPSFLAESERNKKRRAASTRPTRCSTPTPNARKAVTSIMTAPNSPSLTYAQPTGRASAEDFVSSIELPAPLFDFSSFSFENAATPAPLSAFSPCDLPSPLETTVTTPPVTQLHLSSTSPYTMSSWPSPASNTTPEPCSPGLSTPGLDSSEFGFVYPDINQMSGGSYQHSSQCGVGMNSSMDSMGLNINGMGMGLSGYDVAIQMGEDAYLSHSGSVFVAGDYNQRQPISAPTPVHPQQPLDINFSIYMESLSQYAI